jgi:hypothetical protein
MLILVTLIDSDSPEFYTELPLYQQHIDNQPQEIVILNQVQQLYLVA